MFGWDDALAALLTVGVGAHNANQAKEAQNKNLIEQRRMNTANLIGGKTPTSGVGLPNINPQPTNNIGTDWIQPGMEILKALFQGGGYSPPTPLDINMSSSDFNLPNQNTYGLGKMKLNSSLGGGYGRL